MSGEPATLDEQAEQDYRERRAEIAGGFSFVSSAYVTVEIAWEILRQLIILKWRMTGRR